MPVLERRTGLAGTQPERRLKPGERQAGLLPGGPAGPAGASFKAINPFPSVVLAKVKHLNSVF